MREPKGSEWNKWRMPLQTDASEGLLKELRADCLNFSLSDEDGELDPSFDLCSSFEGFFFLTREDFKDSDSDDEDAGRMRNSLFSAFFLYSIGFPVSVGFSGVLSFDLTSSSSEEELDDEDDEEVSSCS